MEMEISAAPSAPINFFVSDLYQPDVMKWYPVGGFNVLKWDTFDRKMLGSTRLLDGNDLLAIEFRWLVDYSAGKQAISLVTDPPPFIAQPKNCHIDAPMLDVFETLNSQLGLLDSVLACWKRYYADEC